MRIKNPFKKYKPFTVFQLHAVGIKNFDDKHYNYSYLVWNESRIKAEIELLKIINSDDKFKLDKIDVEISQRTNRVWFWQ